MEEKNKVAMPIASLVCGIICVLTVIFWYVSVPTGILAIVFGVKSIKKYGSKLGKAGMILGIVGLSLFVLIYMFLITTILFY